MNKLCNFYLHKWSQKSDFLTPQKQFILHRPCLYKFHKSLIIIFSFHLFGCPRTFLRETPFCILYLSLSPEEKFLSFFSLWSRRMASGSPSQASLLLQKQLKGTILFIPFFGLFVDFAELGLCCFWIWYLKICAFSL